MTLDYSTSGADEALTELHEREDANAERENWWYLAELEGDRYVVYLPDEPYKSLDSGLDAFERALAETQADDDAAVQFAVERGLDPSSVKRFAPLLRLVKGLSYPVQVMRTIEVCGQSVPLRGEDMYYGNFGPLHINIGRETQIPVYGPISTKDTWYGHVLLGIVAPNAHYSVVAWVEGMSSLESAVASLNASAAETFRELGRCIDWSRRFQ